MSWQPLKRDPGGATAVLFTGRWLSHQSGKAQDSRAFIEVVPRQWKVLQIVRELFSCRSCGTTTVITASSLYSLPHLEEAFSRTERAVKVYLNEAGEQQLIGRADIPGDVGPVYEVHLFGAASTITDHFMVGTVTELGSKAGDIKVERAIILGPGQRPELLPGWQPLAS